jgi:hypothetical protein
MVIMTERIVYEAVSTDTINEIDPVMTRLEYVFYLKEANDEGREHRANQVAIETKAAFMRIEHWSRFTRELREEFYSAYRAGYVNYKEVGAL